MIADIHIHSSRMIPVPVRYIYNFKHRKNLLPPFPLATLKDAGLNLAFINAVGDPALNKIYSMLNPYSGLKKQIRKLTREIQKAGGLLYKNPDSIEQGVQENRPICVLAIEGADFLDSNISRLQEIYDLGVRSLGLVHFSDNCVGHINTDVLSMVKQVKINEIETPTGGLTNFGETVIKEMNALGMIIDLAHGSKRTVFDAIQSSLDPILVSHTGSQTIQDFSRYLTDEEAILISEHGGLIGLWPFYFQGKGMASMNDFLKHATYLRNLVGSEHLALGTDANGLPGAMTGYKYEKDIHKMGLNLKNHGFELDEVTGIMGNNAVKFLKLVAK